MHSSSTLKTKLLTVTGVMSALGISLLLLVTIGYRDALIAYTGYEFDKLSAQGDVIRQSMKPFLLNGLPIEQFPGFKPLTDPLLQSDPNLKAVYIENGYGEIIFVNQVATVDMQHLDEPFVPSTIIPADKNLGYQAAESKRLLRMTLALEEKFGSSSQLHLVYDRDATTNVVNRAYRPAWAIALTIWLIVLPIAFWFARSERFQQTRWMRLLFGSAFMIVALCVIVIMLNIYIQGVNRKANALTHSLAQRLATPLALGLDTSLFSDLDDVIETYRQLDPDIGYIVLHAEEETEVSSDKSVEHHEYVEHIFVIKSEGESDIHVDVKLGIPVSVVYTSLWRGVRNFLILFFATIFLANLIFSINQILQDKFLRGVTLANQQKKQLHIIRPFYFLIVFAEGLHASFLPQYLHDGAAISGFEPGVVSTIFTLYFLGFVAALLPSGWLIRKIGIRHTLIIGAAIYVFSMSAMTFSHLFWLMFPIRFLAGIGQGILYIAVQGYILEVAKDNRTQAASIIVFGYNGGMISGTVIGALIAVYLNFSGVFLVGAIIALLFLVYVLTLIPSVAISIDEVDENQQLNSLKDRLISIVKDWRFIKTMLLIGIPTKAVLTGVTVFALPLILSELGYRQDDIGMILMLYAAGVLLSSRFAARIVDGGGRTDRALQFGAVGGGVGLVLMGQIDSVWVTGLDSSGMGLALIMGGILILGLGHGFIHAPIVTYVSETMSAEKLGKSSATSLYRFLERIGHVSGPIIVSQLLLIAPRQSQVMLFTGLVLIGFALLFSINFGARHTADVREHLSTLSLGGD